MPTGDRYRLGKVEDFGSSAFKCETPGFSRSNGSFRPTFALKSGRAEDFAQGATIAARRGYASNPTGQAGYRVEGPPYWPGVNGFPVHRHLDQCVARPYLRLTRRCWIILDVLDLRHGLPRLVVLYWESPTPSRRFPISRHMCADTLSAANYELRKIINILL
jgi:hypothetical protein